MNGDIVSQERILRLGVMPGIFAIMAAWKGW